VVKTLDAETKIDKMQSYNTKSSCIHQTEYSKRVSGTTQKQVYRSKLSPEQREIIRLKDRLQHRVKRAATKKEVRFMRAQQKRIYRSNLSAEKKEIIRMRDRLQHQFRRAKVKLEPNQNVTMLTQCPTTSVSCQYNTNTRQPIVSSLMSHRYVTASSPQPSNCCYSNIC
jgi:hypothetical protein